jgi:pyruvate dehydrogenase E2 component (dihydrolipoamide acetyltransferase)
MAVAITVPRLGWSMEEGTFVGWLKKDGERVRAGEALFSLEGDKALQEIEAPADGVLRINANRPAPGSVVRVGDIIGQIEGTNETIASTTMAAAATPGPKEVPAVIAPAPTPPKTVESRPGPVTFAAAENPPERRRITPRALHKAVVLGVDWTLLKGSGRGGRIRERDVVAARPS